MNCRSLQTAQRWWEIWSCLVSNCVCVIGFQGSTFTSVPPLSIVFHHHPLRTLCLPGPGWVFGFQSAPRRVYRASLHTLPCHQPFNDFNSNRRKWILFCDFRHFLPQPGSQTGRNAETTFVVLTFPPTRTVNEKKRGGCFRGSEVSANMDRKRRET